MSTQFVAIQYRTNPKKWLSEHIPQLEVEATVQFDKSTFLVLVPRRQVSLLQKFLLKGVEPPFQKRFSHGKVSTDPAVAFQFDFDPTEPERKAMLQDLMHAAIVEVDKKHNCRGTWKADTGRTPTQY